MFVRGEPFQPCLMFVSNGGAKPLWVGFLPYEQKLNWTKKTCQGQTNTLAYFASP